MNTTWYLLLAVIHLPFLNSIWQECEKTADKKLQYSLKLDKPGICFTENCDNENIVDRESLTIYSSLFESRARIDERERSEVIERLDRIGQRTPEVVDIDRPGMEEFPDEEGRLQTDMDVCCPTHKRHAVFPELTNVDNIRRTIVHFDNLSPEPLYQFVPVGTCVSGGSVCSGRCTQEYRDHYLLVYDPSASHHPPVKFDRFKVESYCSCKGMNG